MFLHTDPTGTPATVPYWFVLDGQGDVVAVTDQSGAVVDRYAYNQWGRETGNDGADEEVPQQLRYRGLYYDEQPSWYWTAANRAYDPALERYLQPDQNRGYVFAGDRPADTRAFVGRGNQNPYLAVDFIYKRMMLDIHSQAFKDIQTALSCQGYGGSIGHNVYTPLFTQCLIEASALFAQQVKPKGPWDYKFPLSRLLGLPFPALGYRPIPNDAQYVYYADIWTNFHFGYIGSAEGFAGFFLHLGADNKIPGVNNGQTDPGDILTEQMGIDLWHKHGYGLKRNDILTEIRSRKPQLISTCKAVTTGSSSLYSGVCAHNTISIT